MKPLDHQASYAEMHYLATTLDQLSDINLWWVDEVRRLNDGIEMNGWAIMPYNKQHNVTFTVNNILFDEIHYPLCNPNLAKIYYFKPNSAMCGFSCVKYTKPTHLTTNDKLLVCRIVDKKTLVPLADYYNIHTELDGMDGLPMPDDKNLARIGALNLQHYKSVGFDKFMRLQEVVKRYVNKTYSEMERILDWGCGCGQVLRYFNRYKNIEVNGADIDIVNIKWCERNLGFAKFHHVPLIPPAKFADEYFDLIIGISVLTHLREHDQTNWLAELSRISRTGALVLLSVHGNGGVAYRNELFDTARLLRWQQNGFIALGVDSAIDSISDKEFYTTSFQTEWYIRKQWANYFKIIDILPAYIGHFQDLVVMQKV